jgi:hypothetical protein
MRRDGLGCSHRGDRRRLEDSRGNGLGHGNKRLLDPLDNDLGLGQRPSNGRRRGAWSRRHRYRRRSWPRRRWRRNFEFDGFDRSRLLAARRLPLLLLLTPAIDFLEETVDFRSGGSWPAHRPGLRRQIAVGFGALIDRID